MSAAETKAQVGKPVTVELRFEPVDGGAKGARSTRAAGSTLSQGGGRPRSSQDCKAAGLDSSSGLACSYIEFAGPIVQKQIVGSMRVAARDATSSGGEGRSVIFTEFARSILARRTVPGDTRNFPPITTDAETIVSLGRTAQALTRSAAASLISYLQPYDPLYFAQGRKSVSISDYSLTLTHCRTNE